MDISSIKITSAKGDEATVLMTDGSQFGISWPKHSGSIGSRIDVWLAKGNRPAAYSHPEPPTAEQIDEAKEAEIGDKTGPLLLQYLLKLENRVRALEGKQSITKEQARNALKRD